jgi:site-specific DNA-methyltransferase (adenine-specific)
MLGVRMIMVMDLKPRKSFSNEGTRYPKSILNISRDFSAQQQVHPTQKPVPLIEWLAKTYTNEGETVLDNCMGSGTTGVACMNTNRNFIGIEMDPQYYEIAKQRIESAVPLQEPAQDPDNPLLDALQ